MGISYYINASAVATDIAPIVTALLTLVTLNAQNMVITRQQNVTAEANSIVTKISKEQNDFKMKELK